MIKTTVRQKKQGFGYVEEIGFKFYPTKKDFILARLNFKKLILKA